MQDLDSESSYSSGGLENNYFIKKHINPVQRGESAFFGDPVSEQREEIIMHSPTPSQQQEYQAQQNRSKINFDQESPEKYKQQEKKQPQKEHDEDEEAIAEMLNEIEKPKVEEQIQKKQEEIVQVGSNEPVESVSRNANQSLNQVNRQQQRSQLIEPVNYQPIEAQQKVQEIPNQQNGRQQQNNFVMQMNMNVNEVVGQELNQMFILHTSQSQQQKLRLKHERANLSPINGDQVSRILEGLKRNTQSIDTAYAQILTQNTILAQFKQDASRKLEENIKVTLKQKINEINRENSKEIKDIKNFSLTVQELLQKNEKRMDKMEKSIEDIFNLLKNKK